MLRTDGRMEVDYLIEGSDDEEWGAKNLGNFNQEADPGLGLRVKGNTPPPAPRPGATLNPRVYRQDLHPS